ncbi:DUF58 domain-containing protein [Caldithrix abyssi]|uniref:VWFA domain-containing protein n=1 Tax=Caldithrix abyssi DSM 13497 TaxID=880073 RepID=H1XZ06_CALAY|nr:DUF58 domain-containing protein [Caldithrix abyssi]APF18030.1 Protein of unknown function DUF58 [Caldithrix abyssi DSM 13497]EHO42077.1 protein of unknown function DUF58 [Caldithrix abyssi DSM 13497]
MNAWALIFTGLGILILSGAIFWYWRRLRQLEKSAQQMVQNGESQAIPRELLKKVKQIEISTRNIVNEVFSGEYHSVFKGRGMEFAEVREYQPGDDIRLIDWNVTARMGHPFIKLFQEERELTVMLLVDVSSSGSFGTEKQLKREVAAELSAVLAFSAIKNNDKVGLIIFSDRIEKFIPPRKGKTHVLRVIREILFYKPRDAATNINEALEFLSRVIKRKSTVFLISDFLAEDFKKSLQIANKKHDIIAVSIVDPREVALPNAGMIELEDAETGETIVIDTTSGQLRDEFHINAMKQREELKSLFQSIGVDHINIFTDQSYVQPINKFFRMRAKRMGA